MTVNVACPEPAEGPTSPITWHGRPRPWPAICLALALAVALIYGQTLRHDFVNYDDGLYVVDNPRVRAGLTWAGVGWAFTTGHAANWHPLTWLSHMLDCQLYGRATWGHHLTNVILHALNAVLLFLALWRLTHRSGVQTADSRLQTPDALWLCAVVAALFAVHPLRVESVAWVAERKDLLSGLFWMLTLGAYARYVERPGARRYLAVALFLALGLMAKPMLVTLPVILLLMDYWQLGRFAASEYGRENGRSVAARLLAEKLPLLALAAVSCAVTLGVQRHGGAVSDLAQLPLWARLANAAVASLDYIVKMLYPRCLIVFYEHPGEAIAPWQAVLAAMLLIDATAVACWRLRRWPWLAVGWAWFLITLAPVIGLVQVGGQAMADRYAYLTQIGLYIVIAWGAREAQTRWRWGRRLPRTALPVLALAAVVAFSVCAWRQTQRWRNSATLFEHLLDCRPDSALACLKLGDYYEQARDWQQAADYYERGLRLRPTDPNLNSGLGRVLLARGQRDEALTRFQRALAADHRFAPALHGCGAVLAARGELEQALACYRQAAEADPDYAPVRIDMGALHLRRGQPARAIEEYDAAARLQPDCVPAYIGLGAAYEALGQFDEAREELRRAIGAARATRDPQLEQRVREQLRSLEPRTATPSREAPPTMNTQTISGAPTSE